MRAYIRGFQGEALGPQSVACMTKHFPGGGPQLDGEDPHFPYGREQVYPGGNFEYHLIPFEAAFAAGTAQIMPYYGMPVGTEHEEVGFGFNRDVITGLLRERYGFDGVVCTDWGLLTDTVIDGVAVAGPRLGRRAPEPPSAPLKAIEAGVDQFGGEACPEVIVELVRARPRRRGAHRRVGAAAAARQVPPRAVRRSVRRPGGGRRASSAAPSSARRGAAAQRARSCCSSNDRGTLPLRRRPRSTSRAIDRGSRADYGEVVDRPEDADVAILRLRAPYEPRDGNLLEALFHAGDLDFEGEELAQASSTSCGGCRRSSTSTSTAPAVIPEIAAARPRCSRTSARAMRRCSTSSSAGPRRAGRLPFELPSSMEAVRRQLPDVPYDSADPLFPFGHGLRYES